MPRIVAIASLLLTLILSQIAAGCGTDSDDSFDDDPSSEAEASFEVDGEQALLSGVIGSSTPDAVEELLANHPEVTTIVLVSVPGSSDDEANLEAARAIRRAGLATHLPANGEAASGGVDLFLAGAVRTFDPGARFGVHSWSTGEPGFHAADLDPTDAEHNRYLDYYNEMGVDEDFYWFTLDAAAPDDIHWMTPAELDRYNFAR